MSDHLRLDKPPRQATSHPGQVSLAVTYGSKLRHFEMTDLRAKLLHLVLKFAMLRYDVPRFCQELGRCARAESNLAHPDIHAVHKQITRLKTYLFSIFIRDIILN